MEKERAVKIISDNISGSNHSFIEDLHEEKRFSTEKLEDFTKAIMELSTTKGAERSIQNFSANFDQLYSYILNSILHHFDQEDLFLIHNLPDHYESFISKLSTAIETYKKTISQAF